MDQTAKMLIKGKLSAVNGLINTAKGMANTPAQPNVPILALNPLVSAVQELSKTIEMLVDKS